MSAEVPVQVPLQRPALRDRLSNPIVSLELLTALRDERKFLMLLVAIGIPAIVVLANWPTGAIAAIGQGELARRLFQFFAGSQLILVALLVPAVLAPSLTIEKEKDTIDLLHTTPLSGDAIVLGKLLSGLGFLLLLCSSAIPLLSMIALFGGVRLEATLYLYFVVVAHGLAYGVTSILISAVSRRTLVAIVLSYVAVAVEALFLLPNWEHLPSTFVRAAVFVGLTYPFARLAARRPYNPVPEAPKEPDPYRDTGLVLRHDAFPDKLIMPPPRTDVLPDGANPIVIKELASGIHGTGSRFIRALIWIGALISLIVLVFTIAQIASQPSASGFGYPYVAFLITFAATLAPAVGARAFSGERDEGTNEMLVLTVIPRGKLVMGKFVAYLRVVLTLSAINTIPFLPAAVVAGSPLRALQLAAVLVSCSTTALAVGFYYSLEARSTVAAMMRSFVSLFGVWVGPVVAAPLLGKPDHWLDLGLRLVSPYHAFAISGRTNDIAYEIAACTLYVVIWSAFSALVLWHCARRFDEAMNTAAER